MFNGQLSVLAPEHDGWTWPLTWRGHVHPLLGDGSPSLIFVGDMSDLFHEDRPQTIIDEVTATLAASPHIGMLLTKRADRMAEHFSAPRNKANWQRWQPRMWLGFSAERQREFDDRWSWPGPVSIVHVLRTIHTVILAEQLLDHHLSVVRNMIESAPPERSK